MNLSFACSLRTGEILGLTWENVHISDEDIAADNAYVYIDKELTMASKRAIETLGEKDLYWVFFVKYIPNEIILPWFGFQSHFSPKCQMSRMNLQKHLPAYRKSLFLCAYTVYIFLV